MAPEAKYLMCKGCNADKTKPDFTAPGHDILSAGHKNDHEIVTMRGTSMAAPHVAGLLAVWKSMGRNYYNGKPFTYENVYQKLVENTRNSPYVAPG